MRKRILLLSLVITGVLLLAGMSVSAAAASLSNNGNPPNGAGGNPPSGPGNICQPGYHGEPAGSNNCVHNGDGAGNCDQNQSANTGKGAGNGGNDYGNGHKPGCGSATPPPPPPPPPPPGQCPAGTTQIGTNPLVCLKTITNTVTNTVTQTVTVYGSPACPVGTTQTGSGQGYVVCNTTTTITPPAGVCPSGYDTVTGSNPVQCIKTVTKTVTKVVVKKVPAKPKKCVCVRKHKKHRHVIVHPRTTTSVRHVGHRPPVCGSR